MLSSHMKSDFSNIFQFRDYAKKPYSKKSAKNILRAIIF